MKKYFFATLLGHLRISNLPSNDIILKLEKNTRERDDPGLWGLHG
jgi:hypothetical protein